MSPEAFPAPHELVELGLERSHADETIVLVKERSRANVRFAVNQMTSNGLARSRDVTAVAIVRSAKGSSVGTVTRSGAVDIEEMVSTAESLARTTPIAPDAADLVGGAADADFAEGPGAASYDELAAIVAGLGRAFVSADAAGVTLAGYAEQEVATTHLGSTTGLRRRFAQPTGTFQLNARVPRPGGSAWTSEATSHLGTVDVEPHVDEVLRRLGWSERFVEVPAGRYDVVLPPIATADLMNPMYRRLSAREAREGRTVFSAPGGGTRRGARLCDLGFSLRSDPGAPGLECLPFVADDASSSASSVFDDGMPLARTSWIDDGVLANLFVPRGDAAREGVEFAAPIENLVLELPGADSTTADLVRRTERGLLLTSLWYIREVDPATLLLTGLTRDGVYLIEGGELVAGVNNFRFNESPVDVLRRTVSAGASVRAMSRESGDEFSRTKMPPLCVADFNMSSVSPAS